MSKERHTCHHPHCETEVPARMFACLRHWRTLPRRYQQRILATYRAGQEEDKQPSRAYAAAALDARDYWLAQQGET